MKRIYVLFIAIAMIFALAACGEEDMPIEDMREHAIENTQDNAVREDEIKTTDTDEEGVADEANRTDSVTDAESTAGADNITSVDVDVVAQPKTAYDRNDLDSMLSAVTSEFEDSIQALIDDSEVLIDKLGESYDTYVENKASATEFYDNSLKKAEVLYSIVETISVDYFLCVAAQGLDDYDTWNGAVEDFYDEWNDCMDDFYDAWDGVYEDIYDKCDEIIEDAYDDIGYDEYSDAWGEMYDIYSDTWSDMYDAHSDAWSETYDNYSNVWSAFYNGNNNVGEIINVDVSQREDIKIETDEDKAEENNDTDIEVDKPSKPVNVSSCEEIEAQIYAEVEAEIAALELEMEALISNIDSYSSYANNVGKVEAFYKKIENTSARLCVKMREYTVEYAEAILASNVSTDDMYDNVDDIYDIIYDNAGEDILDGIYEGVLEEIFDALYDGVLDDRPDGVEYSDWSGFRSDEYKMWSDTRSETYENWSDFRSDVYGFGSDLRSELWNDDTEGALSEIGDFREDVEKMLSKLDSDIATSTNAVDIVEPEEKVDNGAANSIRPEFKEAMDAYEAFYNEYCEFMLAYQENPTDMGLILEYADMLDKLEDMEEALEQWPEDEMNDAEMKYYLEVTSRVAAKLLETAA